MSHTELPPGHYHHFEPEQAYHSSKFGMWMFLATEVHLFGGLFCAFAFFKWKFYDQFLQDSQTLDWRLGGLNTIVLLTSSYLMVRAVDAAQKGDNLRTKRFIDGVLLCGLLFMVIKGIEYYGKFSHGISPSTSLFFGLYFSMTGLHAVHVLGGMIVIYWLRTLAVKNMYSETYYTPVEVTGLYWHLVDIVWIYLFPLLYLLGGV